jgi:hypothetical protein
VRSQKQLKRDGAGKAGRDCPYTRGRLDRANRADLRAAVAAAVVAELLAARSRVPGVGEAEGWGVGIERDCSGRECGW